MTTHYCFNCQSEGPFTSSHTGPYCETCGGMNIGPRVPPPGPANPPQVGVHPEWARQHPEQAQGKQIARRQAWG